MNDQDEMLRTVRWLLSPNSPWQSRQPVVLGTRSREPRDYTAFACIFLDAPVSRTVYAGSTGVPALRQAIAASQLPTDTMPEYWRAIRQRYPYEKPEGLWGMGRNTARSGGPLMPIGFYALGQHNGQPSGVLWMHSLIPPDMLLERLRRVVS